jgi:hypothetical protein
MAAEGRRRFPDRERLLTAIQSKGRELLDGDPLY